MQQAARFNVGDTATCVASRGYNLTTGKDYTVARYEPEYPEPGIGFTWPAYVWVTDDAGRPAVCHASRFKAPAVGMP